MTETPYETGPRTVVIQLQPEDLAMAQRLHFWQHVFSRAGLIRLSILCVIATAAFAYVLWLMGNKAVLPVAIFALITPFAVLGFPFLITQMLGGIRARKTFAQQKTLQKPTCLAWDEQGVVMKSDYGHARAPWTDFRKAREDERLILLYESDRLYRLIPKRCLSATQLADIQSCLAAVPPG
ncbi:YcxB family protein [uncultured Pseudomonas sp.]|uniref:YcxB family protein n=1 Tax=uncultured Pseudomonas sp. TaxID=114707 RepID=UPI0025F3C42A|nr:YcxB family protein [uncultured Pseudomonas sp.]